MTLSEYLIAHDERPSAFAVRARVAPSTIGRILRGEREPGLAVAVRISRATDGLVSPEDLLCASKSADGVAKFSNDGGRAAEAGEGIPPPVSSPAGSICEAAE